MFFLIVGLGNPGPEYADTRHNVGFRAVERLASRHRIPWRCSESDCQVGTGRIGGAEVALARPMTFMNLSGRAVAWACQHFGADPDRMAVIHDDLDLAPGRIQIRRGGGSAGHRGIESILEHCGGADFVRVRIGIGRPANGQEAADFVLEPPGDPERAPIEAAVERAADAAEIWISEGLSTAMNRCNPWPERACEEQT